MKLILSALLLCLAVACEARSQSGTISIVPDTSYSQRDTFVTISVVADVNVKALKALQVDIDVNPLVVYADTLHVTLGDFFVINGDSTFFHYSLSPTKSRLTIDWAILGDGKTRSGPGLLAQIRYKTVGFGTSTIVIAGYKLRDSLNQPVVAETKNGWIKVCRYVGDINGDNHIDLTDLSTLVAFLTTGSPVPVPYESANTNCLGIVDLSDLSLMVAYLTTSAHMCRLCL